MPRYEVLLKAYRSVLVEADDEEDAFEIVQEECVTGISDWDIDDITIEQEIKSDQEYEVAKRSGATPIEDW